MTRTTTQVSGDLETNLAGVCAAGDMVGMLLLGSTGIEQAKTVVLLKNSRQNGWGTTHFLGGG